LESLAEQLAALTGVSAATWLKPGTFTGPLDKAANLQNLITAIGIWNALKAKPAEALNAIKTGLPNLWNSTTNAFKNNPLAAWGTALGTTIAALLGGYTAICGLSSTLSLLHLAGFVSLPLAGLLTTDKKQRVYGILVGMLLSGMVLSACVGGSTTTPIAPPTGEWLCPAAPTSTPTPTQTPLPPTATPDPSLEWLQSSDNLDLATHYQNLSTFNYWIENSGLILPSTNSQDWQNLYNDQILAYAKQYGIPPYLLKGLIMKESHFALSPFSNDATGLAQITLIGFDKAFSKGSNTDFYIQLAYKHAFRSGEAGGAGFPSYDPSIYSSYQDYYVRGLNGNQRTILRTEAQKMVDGYCYPADVSVEECRDEDSTSPLLKEGVYSIDLAAQILAANKQELIENFGDAWNRLPEAEQWKIVAASYNGGVQGVTNAFTDAQAEVQANGGQVQSWDQIKNHLDGNVSVPKDTIKYSDIIVCYALGNGDSPCE
jgi:hypothetical protein